MALETVVGIDLLVEFMHEVRSDHKKLCESTALEVLEAVVDRTPVYTGDLRASWKISVSKPDLGIVVGGTPSSPLAAPDIPKTLGQLPDFPTIYVTNSTPYAEAVNDGSPTNAPVHMLELALLSLQK